MSRFLAILIALAWSIGSIATIQAAESVASIPTRSGVTEAVIVDGPPVPTAAVILLPGGGGYIGIHDDGGHPRLDNSGNFLVRSRALFVEAGFLTVTVDVPSDRPNGINEAFRIGSAHSQDIAAIVAWVRQKSKVPVWLVGTSMGTISATAAAITLGKQIDGLVLTSSVSVVGTIAPNGGVLGLDVAAIPVPTLVMDHTLDACSESPPGNAAVIAGKLTKAPRTAVKMIDGGDTPRSAPCQAMSYHGYLGVEGDEVKTIAAFMNGRP